MAAKKKMPMRGTGMSPEMMAAMPAYQMPMTKSKPARKRRTSASARKRK